MTTLANGQSFFCKACSQESIVKQRPRMEGFTHTGDDFVCALCGHVLASADTDEQEPSDTGSQEARKKLLNVLGDAEESGPDMLGQFSDEERHFCRDCRHFIQHPFQTRCGLHDTPVGPMSDCPSYEKRAVAE